MTRRRLLQLLSTGCLPGWVRAADPLIPPSLSHGAPAPIESGIRPGGVGALAVERSATISIAENFPGSRPATLSLVEGFLPRGVTFIDGRFTAAADAELSTSGLLIVAADDGVNDNITTFKLSTSAPSATYPFTLGLVFARGDVPASVALSIPAAQVVIKRRWSDGSAKHAIVSGRAPLIQNTASTITVMRGRTAPGTGLTSADIRAAAPVAAVQCGSLGSVQLSTLLTAPFRTWVSGPEMVECHYRRAIGSGTRLVAWFHVRLFADGRMWIRVICENGVIGDTNSNQTYVPSLSIGGTELYSNGGKPIQHREHVRYSAEAWIGANPLVTPTYDVAYLQSTKMVPNYGWRKPDAAAFKSLAQGYLPLFNGNIDAAMGSPGFGVHIGLLPLWDALFVSSGDVRAYRAVLGNSSHLNSWGICWRDHRSGDLFKPADYPNWTSGGDKQGVEHGPLTGYTHAGTQLTFAGSHLPSGGYLAYLITGDYWHYETLAMSAGASYLARTITGGPGTRRMLDEQIRTSAWATRTLAQLSAIAPDGDAVAANYRLLFSAQIDGYHARLSVPGAKPLGIVHAWGTYNPKAPVSQAPWMQHFWVGSVGYAWDMEPGLADNGKFHALRDFMYKSVVGIVGGSNVNEFHFTFAGSYTYTIGPHVNPDFAIMLPDKFFSTWGEVFQASTGNTNRDFGNTLQGTSGAAPAAASTGYWGNMLPALAYAVEHKAPGAQPAWERLTRADNWNVMRDSGFHNIPIWGVIPRGARVN